MKDTTMKQAQYTFRFKHVFFYFECSTEEECVKGIPEFSKYFASIQSKMNNASTSTILSMKNVYAVDEIEVTVSSNSTFSDTVVFKHNIKKNNRLPDDVELFDIDELKYNREKAYINKINENIFESVESSSSFSEMHRKMKSLAREREICASYFCIRIHNSF